MIQIRQLAAIMFTDIAGYTALMSKDEYKTLELIKINKQIHRKWLKVYGGKWLKEAGDGIMASFSSVSDAIYCAAAIQEEIKTLDLLNLRIGIHVGEVVVEGKEIYGDGVNIASRIESVASPGQILVSEAVFKNIKNKDDIAAEFAGTHKLKNVEDPVTTYRVSVATNTLKKVAFNDGLNRGTSSYWRAKFPLVLSILVLIVFGLFYFLEGGSPPSEITESNIEEDLVIAVLPFVDLSPSQDQEYLGAGIAEEIINGLTKIRDLKVIGRTSSFSLKNQQLDLQTIGNKLGANLVLEGSIRKSATKIRITAQLIDATDGSHIWSETYDKELDDIFIIQDDISDRIAEKLKLSVTLSTSDSPPTKDIAAYELYLKGRHLHFQGLFGSKQARDLLEEAIEIDPAFVDALHLLSEIYWSISLYGLGDRSENIRLAKKSILKAIEIDSSNHDAYAYLAFLNLTNDWDWNAATENYHRAVELGLQLPDRNHLYYQAIIHGPGDQVVEDAKQLVTSDPLSVQFLTDLSRMYLFSKRYNDVIDNGNRTLALSPDNTSILRHMGSAYLALGDMANALNITGNFWKQIPPMRRMVTSRLLWAWEKQKKHGKFLGIFPVLFHQQKRPFHIFI